MQRELSVNTQRSTQANWGHPCASGLTLLYRPAATVNARNMAREDRAGAFSGTIPIKEDDGGVVRTASGGNGAITFGSPDSILGTSQGTVFIRWRRTQGTPNAIAGLIATVAGASNTGYWAVTHNFNNDNLLCYDVSGTTGGSSRVSVTRTWAVNQWNNLLCCHGPRGMEIWLNGVRIANNAATPSRTTGGVTSLVYGAATPFPGYSFNADQHDLSHLYLWNAQLNADQIRMISHDPDGLILQEAARGVPGWMYGLPVVGNNYGNLMLMGVGG